MRSCPTCAALLPNHWRLGFQLAEPPITTSEPEPLLLELEARLRQEQGARAWLRSRSTRLRHLIAAALVIGLALYQFFWARRQDWFDYPAARMLLTLGAYALGVAVCVNEALRPLGKPRRQSSVVLAASMLSIPFVIAALPEASVGVQPPEQAFVATAIDCLVYGSAWASVFALTLWWMDRRERLSRTAVLVLAGGIAVAANLLLQLHCPNPDAAHLMAGHASVGAVWLSAIWIVRALWLRTRARQVA